MSLAPDCEDRGEHWGTRLTPARHAQLHIDPASYSEILAARPELDGEPLLVDWARLGRPLIARRRAPCDREGLIAAGLALPPAHGKKRVAFALDAAAVYAAEPPPALADCAEFAPCAWRAMIDALLDLCASVRVNARVFGALAWTAMTGLDYLRAGSDLDLLFPVGPRSDPATLLAGLARIDAAAPMRIDGEVLRLEAGLAAHWREVAAGGAVLVKTVWGVALMSATDFLSSGAAASDRRVAS